eukprot:5485875-Amphidinium_carterae.1
MGDEYVHAAILARAPFTPSGTAVINAALQCATEGLAMTENYAGARREELVIQLRLIEQQLRGVAEHAASKPSLYVAGAKNQRVAARREAVMAKVRSVAAFTVGVLQGFQVVATRDPAASTAGQMTSTILDSASLQNAGALHPQMLQAGQKMAGNCGAAKTTAVESTVRAELEALTRELALGFTTSPTMVEPIVVATDSVTGA